MPGPTGQTGLIRDDLAWRLLRDGYRALDRERRRHDGRDAFATRMLARRTVVVRGEEGARLFYDEAVVARTRAVPPPLAWLLFGRGAVHGLDGAAHRERKRLFLEVLTPERTEPLVAAVRARLQDRVPSWKHGTPVFDELVEVYGGAVLSWAGIRLDDVEAARVSHRLAEIVDGFGFAGVAYARGWRSRLVANRWARRLVREVREGSSIVQRDRPLGMIAARADLDDRTAAVELLNVLRPTVAVAWPATLATAQLLRSPEPATVTSDELLRPYVHECRRLQPFAPRTDRPGPPHRDRRRSGAAPGRPDRARRRRHPHRPAHLVARPRRPPPPSAFEPRRFADGEPSPYALVPQGGGDPATGHRCPGEPLTVRLLEVTLREIARHGLRPVAGGEPDLRRMPTLPDPPLRVTRTSPDAAGTPGYWHGGGRPVGD
ncbi:hypothetical protein [Nocardioides sp. TF02-7]|uniref:hypothetical protein n=1 Tax=Nocardioides sp. TF02-7 TaxID=2917724 RepID=UPI001F055FD7|nr:hypothetical protein [Nocardioides sp. TF02-7]UMG93663.1 hypothetical protein MF408_05625 [Nocardioides sp. TF02-7]